MREGGREGVMIYSLLAHHLHCHAASQFLHLSQHGGDEGGLACPHLPHHCHQLARLDVQVEAVPGGGRDTLMNIHLNTSQRE